MLYRLLGYAGLIPFLGLAVLSQVTVLDWDVQLVLLSYAAMIYSFLGGVLWGAAVVSGRHEKGGHSLLWVSVISMLWSWGWLLGTFLWPEFNFLWLASGSFLLLWLYETRVMNGVFPELFMRLRRNLSWVAALSLFVGGWS